MYNNCRITIHSHILNLSKIPLINQHFWVRMSNRLAPYYMGPKRTGELWVYIGTPLPNPSGNTGVMVCMYVFLTLIVVAMGLLFIKIDFKGY